MVTQKLPNGTYIIEDISGQQRMQKFDSSSTPVDKLKRYLLFIHD